jgi:indole-3-glycerol phosphate synthase
MNILEKIVAQTKEDLAKRRRRVSARDFESFASYERERKSFSGALEVENSVSVIAEVKKASPSKGVIRDDFNPLKIAEAYIENGASAISVLTDEPFFQGSLDYLAAIAEESPLPLLRKDFLIDPYQVKEARAYGADAVLLIATICEGNQLSELLAATREFGLQALVECYHEEELLGLNWNEVEIVGVNNRNLSTFEVDLHRGVEILTQAPKGVVRVSESGIREPEDLQVLHRNGIHSALIGEHFMRQPDIGQSLRQFITEFEENRSSELSNQQ